MSTEMASPPPVSTYANPSLSNVPNDTIYPSVTLLQISQTYTGPKLDASKSNYKSWLKNITIFLTVTGLKGYVKGTIPIPGDNEPRAKRNWGFNDEMATAILASSVEEREWEDLNLENSSSKMCWDLLEKRFKNEGATGIKQVELLREGLTTVFTHDISLIAQSDKIRDSFNRAYEMGDVTKDMLLCIAHLTALRNFPHLQSLITRDISAATTSTPFKFTQLRAYMDREDKLRALNGISTLTYAIKNI